MISNHMGLVPLTDSVFVVKQSDPLLDDWGQPIYETIETEYKCHISYNYKLESISIRSDLGTQVVYSAKIYFRGLVTLKDEYKIKFTDMNGEIVEKKVLNVSPVRDFGGRVLSTCLYV